MLAVGVVLKACILARFLRFMILPSSGLHVERRLRVDLLTDRQVVVVPTRATRPNASYRIRLLRGG